LGGLRHLGWSMAPYRVNSTTGAPHRQIGQRQVM